MKALQIETVAKTHILIRDRAGRKLFEVDASGCSVAIAVPSDAEIQFAAPQAIAEEHAP